MAKILLIETATEVCSVAVGVDGTVVALQEAPPPQNHAAILTLQIAEAVREAGMRLADLDAVALSAGPGSYTGLRVGASAAKGICYALGKPLLAVNTLQALAWGARAGYPGDFCFVPMLDARRNEVWTALFDHRLNELAPAQALVLENNSFEKFLSGVTGNPEKLRFVVSGNGAFKLENGALYENVEMAAERACSAKFMAELAEVKFQNADFQDVAYFEPLYMKPPNITSARNNTLSE